MAKIVIAIELKKESAEVLRDGTRGYSIARLDELNQDAEPGILVEIPVHDLDIKGGYLRAEFREVEL